MASRSPIGHSVKVSIFVPSRHELPVTGERIPVLHEDSDVVVVDKPSSIPIHPCGRYRHNSLTFILDKDYGYKNLRSKSENVSAVNFPQSHHKRHPIARPLGWGMQCLLWIQILIYVLLQSMQCCKQQGS